MELNKKMLKVHCDLMTVKREDFNYLFANSKGLDLGSADILDTIFEFETDYKGYAEIAERFDVPVLGIMPTDLYV